MTGSRQLDSFTEMKFSEMLKRKVEGKNSFFPFLLQVMAILVTKEIYEGVNLLLPMIFSSGDQ